MEETGLIIFYSNPTYLPHLLLSPVRSDMSAISYRLIFAHPGTMGVLLIHEPNPARLYNKAVQRPCAKFGMALTVSQISKNKS